MEFPVIAVFVLGYLAIALEHPLRIDKSATALITGVACWTLYVLGGQEVLHVDEGLSEHLSEIASILFFLMGAMTIVELVDNHDGFSMVTNKITTTSKVKLLWIVGLMTFFFSAVLDNLTTTIVMVSLLRKLISDKQARWFYAGMVVIAANAGGAWSPIGDVTTTMLWIKKQLPNTGLIVTHLFLPSITAILAPLIVASLTLKGKVTRPKVKPRSQDEHAVTDKESSTLFTMGLAGLLFVPVFKTVTHLPPFMGMMLSLGVLWVTTEIMHRNKNGKTRISLSVVGALKRVDFASVLFFLGILLAVAALQEMGALKDLAQFLDRSLGDIYVINICIGLLSAIIDNVPLVAAAQGMYPIAEAGPFMHSGDFWQFLAYCAGTGGSALIIGSAAGVAAMGLEKIDFIWYMKKMSLLALLGYFAGAVVFILMF